MDRLLYKWTEESTKEFIRLRIKEENLFTGKKNAAKVGWEYILAQLGLTNMVTVKQCKKKWTNLCQKYKEIKRFAAESGTDGEHARQSWPYYKMIDEYLTKSRSPRSDSLRISSVRSGSNHSPGSSDYEGIEEEEEEEGYLIPGEEEDDEPLEEEVEFNHEEEGYLDENFEPYCKRTRYSSVEGEMMQRLRRFDEFCRRSEARQEESLNLLKEIVFLLQK